LIGILPIYSNAKDPDSDLAAQLRGFLHFPDFLHLLLKKVIHEHPQVKSQVQAMQVAGLEVLIAQQAYWPTPSISMERVQSQTPDLAYNGSPQVLTFRLQQPLWTGGRLTAQNNKALASQGIESARLNEIQHSLALKTLQAWTEVVSSLLQQKTLEVSLVTQSQLLNKIVRRAEQGLSSRSEVNYSSLRWHQLKQEISNAKQQERQAWIRLKQWVPEAETLSPSIGSDNSRTPQANTSRLVKEIVNVSLAQWELEGLANSPLVDRLKNVSQFQLAELAEKRATLQPEMYVRAEHQRGNYGYVNSPPTNRVFVGLSASTGAGLSLGHQLAALQNKHQGTLEEITTAQRAVLEAVQTDYLNVNARQSKATALQFNLKSSQEMQAAWERQFINGKKTWIDVMNAARETTQAELAVIENDMAILQSYWRLQIHAYGLLRWATP
jgi:adhesin transport system outer membrane protein